MMNILNRYWKKGTIQVTASHICTVKALVFVDLRLKSKAVSKPELKFLNVNCFMKYHLNINVMSYGKMSIINFYQCLPAQGRSTVSIFKSSWKSNPF